MRLPSKRPHHFAVPARLAAGVLLLSSLSARAAGPDGARSPSDFVPVPGLDEEEADVPTPLQPSPERAQAAAPEAEPAAPPDLTLLAAEPVHGIASSGFGWRDDPIRHRRKFHYGGDFRAPRGTPVYAAGPGTVVYCGRRHGYGKVIDVRHHGSLLTRYAHLTSIEVKCGQVVEADERIGQVGSTGRATGPHLHFEVRVDAVAVDPVEAMRVAELQRGGDTVETRRLASALRSSAATAVSAIDPPRAARESGARDAKARSRSRARRRPIS